jgi:hypothetical protein
MILLQTIQLTLIEVYELLKKSIKDSKPTQYAGQNLSKLAEDFRDDAKKLTIAGFYDHGLMLSMLKIFLEAGGDGRCAENFRYKIYQWIEQMEEAMLTIWFMEKDDQDAHMLKKELTYRQITDQMETHYINLLHKEEWIPLVLSSTRAELFGIAAPNLFLFHFMKFYQIESTSKCVKCVDNRASISRVNQTQHKHSRRC